MSVQKISNAIPGVGVDDTTIDLFESQYPVPTGVSYNSYVILDEKVAILDTVDDRATDAWLANLTEALGDRMPEYLVVSHMEPDHGANPPVLPEHRGQVRPAGAGTAQKGSRTGYCHHLPAARPGAHRGPGQVSGLL